MRSTTLPRMLIRCGWRLLNVNAQILALYFWRSPDRICGPYRLLVRRSGGPFPIHACLVDRSGTRAARSQILILEVDHEITLAVRVRDDAITIGQLVAAGTHFPLLQEGIAGDPFLKALRCSGRGCFGANCRSDDRF